MISNDFRDMLRAMCPTSREVENFKMGPNKFKYIASHDLCPYFREDLKCDLERSPFVTIIQILKQVIQKGFRDTPRTPTC